MYLCHLHRYADEDEPCDECPGEVPPRAARPDGDCVARLREAMARLTAIRPALWRQGQARD